MPIYDANKEEKIFFYYNVMHYQNAIFDAVKMQCIICHFTKEEELDLQIHQKNVFKEWVGTGQIRLL